MGSNYVTRSFILCTIICCVRGYVCPLETCAMVKCDEITASSCAADDRVLMPYAGFCGCCPACVNKISKGNKCPGFLLTLGAPERAGCETGTECKKIADDTFVCD